MQKANVKCPEWGNVQEMEIPEGKCIPLYKCKRVISVKEKCCIFCEYSDTKCSVSQN